MSPIGRVFIVLNLLLSGLFLGYAAFYLKNVDSYRTMYQDEVARAQQEKKDLDGQISQLQTELTAKSTDLTTYTTTLRQKELQLKAAEEENTSMKSRLNALQAKVDSLDASMSTVATTLDNQNKRLQEITDNWLKAKEERNKAVASRDDFMDKLRASEASLTRSKAREESLVSELGEKNTEIRKLTLELDVIKDAFPDAARIAARAVPAVEGTIMDVNTDLGTVAISLGANQAGVEKGWVFAVHDGSSYKGEIVITDVSENMGYGRIDKIRPGQSIRKGDRASTRLR